MWGIAANLLRKIAPAAISWGIGKLANTNVVRKHIMPLMSNPMVQGIAGSVQ